MIFDFQKLKCAPGSETKVYTLETSVAQKLTEIRPDLRRVENFKLFGKMARDLFRALGLKSDSKCYRIHLSCLSSEILQI